MDHYPPTVIFEFICEFTYACGSKVFTNAITKDLMDCGHKMDISKVLKLINTLRIPLLLWLTKVTIIKSF